MNQCGHCGNYFDQAGAYCDDCENAKNECYEEYKLECRQERERAKEQSHKSSSAKLTAVHRAIRRGQW